jgi:trehalose-phosphatase
MKSGRTHVAVISGRDANDISPLLGLEPAPEVWGLHGLQRRKFDESVPSPSLDERSADGLSDAQRWLAYQGLQHAAEQKATGIAFHWRGRDEQQTEQWRGRVLLGWNPIALRSGLRLLEFDGGIEICARQSDKGVAVRALLRDAGPDTPAAYLGDDATDECAFRALAGRGLGILVRPRFRKTAAQIWIQPPDDLIEFLSLWLAASQQYEAVGNHRQAAVNQ